jgi:hypothetical protein
MKAQPNWLGLSRSVIYCCEERQLVLRQDSELELPVVGFARILRHPGVLATTTTPILRPGKALACLSISGQLVRAMRRYRDSNQLCS